MTKVYLPNAIYSLNRYTVIKVMDDIGIFYSILR